MPLPDEFLNYPFRRHGMDHDRYEWSHLFDRKPVAWPNGARVALWITPILQWFPIDSTGKPFRAPGGLTNPYPDYRHYSQRDYGSRVGIYRIMELLQSYELPASVAANGVIAERHPGLIRELVAAGYEIVAHGLDMDTVHHSGLSAAEETDLVRRALEPLRRVSGQKVGGWLSPGRAQSFATPDILAANGIEYGCDWANDDLPYQMKTASGSLHAMPHAFETDDWQVLVGFHHREDEWVAQMKDQFDVLYRESAKYGGRVMSIPLHAWVSGTPYRISYVREILDHILSREDVWPATGADILAAFRQQA